jgi:hypothetical protein
MRLGHAGVALAAKRFSPAVPLWFLIGVAYGPDALEVALRVVGQHDTMLSHSLVSVGVCATLAAAAYAAVNRDARGALVVWLTYVLHWPADFITGHKPTWPGGPVVGLDYYSHTRRVWLVDLGVFAAGWLIYRYRTNRNGERRGG